MRALAIAIVIGGCGSATPAPTTVPVRSDAKAEPAPDAICARLEHLRNEHCGSFIELDLDAARCPIAFHAAQDGAPSTERLAMRALGRCVVANSICIEAQACVAKIEHYQVKPRQRAPLAEAVCERLHGALARCDYKIAGKDREACVATLTQHPSFLESTGHCWADEGDDCDRVTTCMQESVFDKTNLRACTDVDPDKAVGMLQAAWARRKGAGLTRYSAARSTKSAPIEVCGFVAENNWLFAATCDDGSHPISRRDQAESARVGNEGAAGRCSSTIDLYRVKCPETTYEIHIDAYVCPLSE